MMLVSVFGLVFTFFAVCLYGTNSLNVTFDPKPIQINIADLPLPYATPYSNKKTMIVPVPSDPHLLVPNGFVIKVYTTDIFEPRLLLHTPTGNILAVEPEINRISCLLDTDNDGFPDQRRTFADATNGLDYPNGVVFANNFFYVGNLYHLRRYEWDTKNCHAVGNGTIVMEYLATWHGRRTIVINPSADKIYVTIGSDSDADAEDPPRATVQQANIDGSNMKTFASGLRNPSGMTIHPITQDIYVTCNERNELGDDLVPDFFTRIQQDDFFGWPYAYLSADLIDPTRVLPNGTSERPDLVARTKTPDVLLQAHCAPLDVQFYTGQQFPTRYRNGAFVAIHGAQARREAIGYSIAFIPFDSVTNRPLGYYEDFVTGFLLEPYKPRVFGRPTGLLVLKDGSLIFTEDGNNRIYQVQYNNQSYFYNLSSIIFLIACNFLFRFITL